MNNELVVLDGFQQCAWRLLRRRNGKNVAGGGEGERVRASYFGLMRVDTAALFYGLLKRTSDKGPSINDVRIEGEWSLAEKQT